MKIWTSSLVAGAILAFAAPAGYSAIPWDTQSGPGHRTMRIIDDPRPLSKQTAAIKAPSPPPPPLFLSLSLLRAENKALAAKVKALAAENKALGPRSTRTSDQLTRPPPSRSSPCWSAPGARRPCTDPIDYPSTYDWSC